MTLKRIFPIIILIIIALMLTACNSDKTDNTLSDNDFQELIQTGDVVKAEIIEITDTEDMNYDISGEEQITRIIYFEAELLDKGYANIVFSGRQTLDSMSGYQAKAVEAGDKVFLYPGYDENGQPIGEMAEYDRTEAIIILVVIFALLLLILSRLKGLRALLALLVSLGSIFFIFIPMVLDGKSPVSSSILVCVINIVATLIIVYGFNIKTFSAAGGCLTGVIIAGVLAYIMQGMMHLTGMNNEQAIMLFINYEFNMNGLMFAAIIIGALGAAMDVAISIASSLEEIVFHTKTKLGMRLLFKSGMKIGSDIMGTMTNTLILAYIGSALPLVLLIALNSIQLEYVISWEMLSTEFLRALAGSIGLISVVPATSFISSLLYRKPQKHAPSKAEQNPWLDYYQVSPGEK